MARNVPGDAKPIILEADQISSWTEGGKVVFLLTGQVLVQQSVVLVRCEQGVAWIDMNRYKATGILHMDLYAEGQVWLDASSNQQKGPRAVLDLNTRGEFLVRAAKGKMQRQDRGSDPVVNRSRTLGVGPGRISPPSGQTPVVPVAAPSAPLQKPVAPAIQPAGGIVPTPPAMPGSVRQTSFEQPLSGRSGPASSRIQLAQAIAPGPAGSAIPDGPPDSVPPPDRTGPGATLPLPGSFPSPGSEPVVPPGSGPRPTPGVPSISPTPFPTIPTPPINPEVPPSVLPSPSPTPPTAPPLPPPSEASPPPRPPLSPSKPGLPLAYRVLPRSGKKMNLNSEQLPNGRRMITVTGGLILNVRNVPRIGTLDMEADRAVIWVTDNQDPDGIARGLQANDGTTSNELEFYLGGHVILRTTPNSRERIKIQADELFYDVRRNVAVALQTTMEMRTQRFNTSNTSLTEPMIITTPRLLQKGANTFEVTTAEIFSSKLPSDPGLRLLVASATVTNGTRPRTNLFGQPVLDKKGQPQTLPSNIIEARDVFSEFEGIPYFWTPYLKTDVGDPMGPLQTIGFGVNNIFGVTANLGFDVYKLFGLDAVAGTRWRLLTDYMSLRGPALGSNFDYTGEIKSLMHMMNGDEITPKYNGYVRLYGLQDAAQDILGGDRPYLPFNPPGLRGRADWQQNVYDLPYGFDVISQVSFLSDRNFLEQYFKREFDTGANQANFLYVKQQQDNWAWSALGQVQTSPWITTTEWLPRLDGYLIGQPLFDLFTTNTRIGAAYANLRPSNDPSQTLVGTTGPPAYPYSTYPQSPGSTTRGDSTGRLYFQEEVGLPLDLGAFKVVPYAKTALVDYTNDLNGNNDARAWGGLGVRASVPLTRLYPDVQSDLFNLNGINHKVVLSSNWLYARASDPYTKVPQLDRLNDDATESMLREFKPQEPAFNTQAGLALATSPLFDPQQYAIRRLVMNRIDTLNNIDVLQLDANQRLQTKRGFPGAEHIVDWMTLDTSVSLFPETNQNFGKAFSFLEYQYRWNIGDRTTFESTGWYDPQDQGARVYTVGMYFNRPDRTSFYVGYRQTDPLQSRVITGSVSYVFSPKYAMTLSTAYDMGTSAALTNTMIFTRTGSDLQVSLGFSYNSLQNNFGAIIEIVPSLLPINGGNSNLLGAR